MASEILRPSVSVTGIFDSNYNQLFVNAHVIDAKITESSKFMEHPIESGGTVVDHKIILPIEISLSLIVLRDSYTDTYNQIKKAFLSGNTYLIQTKTSIYKNMAFISMPHDEKPEMFDALAIPLSMKEVLFVTTTFGKLPASKVRKKSDADKKDAGEKQGKIENKTNVTSAIIDIVNFSRKSK